MRTRYSSYFFFATTFLAAAFAAFLAGALAAAFAGALATAVFFDGAALIAFTPLAGVGLDGAGFLVADL